MVDLDELFRKEQALEKKATEQLTGILNNLDRRIKDLENSTIEDPTRDPPDYNKGGRQA